MPDISKLVGLAVDAAGSTDMVSLIKQAHWIVKVTMALLTGMFLVGVYIIIYKTLYIRRASVESVRFNESFWRSRDIEQIYKHAQVLRNSPVSQMFLAGYTELAKLSADERMKADREGSLDNIVRALRKAQTVETTRLESMTRPRAGAVMPARHRSLASSMGSMASGAKRWTPTWTRVPTIPRHIL